MLTISKKEEHVGIIGLKSQNVIKENGKRRRFK